MRILALVSAVWLVGAAASAQEQDLIIDETYESFGDGDSYTNLTLNWTVRLNNIHPHVERIETRCHLSRSGSTFGELFQLIPHRLEPIPDDVLLSGGGYRNFTFDETIVFRVPAAEFQYYSAYRCNVLFFPRYELTGSREPLRREYGIASLDGEGGIPFVDGVPYWAEGSISPENPFINTAIRGNLIRSGD